MKKFEDIDLESQIDIATVVNGLYMERWEDLFDEDKELIKEIYEKILLNPNYQSHFDTVVRITRSLKEFNKSNFDYNMGILKSMYPSKIVH